MAQTSAMVASGGTIQNNGITVTYTIGELMVGTANFGDVNMQSGILVPSYAGFTQAAPTSVKGGLTNDTKVYPNPTTDYLYLDGDDNGANVLLVLNSLGQVAGRYTMQGNRFDVRTLTPGMYRAAIQNTTTSSVKSITFIKE